MTSTKPEPRELRVALAMRGGVSLAVWMGGACSEVDALRRARGGPAGEVPEPGSVGDLYQRLLSAVGYDSVAVDVVAGASAGGLNGVLMGCSVVHDMRFDHRIRDLWLTLGDLGNLRRRVKVKAQDSPLDGDGAFYTPLARELRELVGSPIRTDPDVRLDLSLTGTLLDARRSRRHQDLGPAIVESRNRARFRFRHLPHMLAAHSDQGLASDFDAPGQSSDRLGTLAYAARATSSFPGAFEPASVGYAPDSVPPSHEADIPASHHGVYSESRLREGMPDRDLVIDGGVLDNIPVGWAIRTIAAAPANVVVDRWLVYLQPLPFEPPQRRGPNAAPPKVRETIKRARSLQSGTEGLSEDIDELERLRSASLRRGGFAQVLEYALGQVPASEEKPEFLDKLFERALAAAPSYRSRLDVIEKDRVGRLWTDPMAVLGVDVLGYHALAGINSDKSAGDDRSALLADLRTCEYQGVLGSAEPLATNMPATPEARRAALCAFGRSIQTPQHLARTVAVLLDSARLLEGPGLAVKASLYDLRTRIELLVASHDRYLAAEPTLLPEGDANTLVRRASWRLAQQSSTVPDWSVSPDADAQTTAWPQAPFEDLIAELVVKARELAEAAPAPGDGDTEGRALLRCLLLAAADTASVDETTEAVLVAVELLAGPLRTDPLAESAPIRFHMLSAANQSPLGPLRPRNENLSVVDKLAGNQLMNFGAFFSARWRMNDWIWGRLDAAVSLVDVVMAGVDREEEAAAQGRLAEQFGFAADLTVDEMRTEVVSQLHRRILREELPLLQQLDDDPPGEVPEVEIAADPDPDPGPLLAIGREPLSKVIRRNRSLVAELAAVGGVGAQSWGADLVKKGWSRVTGWLKSR